MCLIPVLIPVLDLNPGALDQDLNPGALDQEPRCSTDSRLHWESEREDYFNFRVTEWVKMSPSVHFTSSPGHEIKVLTS